MDCNARQVKHESFSPCFDVRAKLVYGNGLQCAANAVLSSKLSTRQQEELSSWTTKANENKIRYNFASIEQKRNNFSTVGTITINEATNEATLNVLQLRHYCKNLFQFQPAKTCKCET